MTDRAFTVSRRLRERDARRRDGDGRSDDEAVIARFDEHLGLADRLSRRYSHGHRADDDLRQVARLGLLLASRRFAPEKGQFARFATVTIVGELKKHLRSHGWAVHVPRKLQEDSITVAGAMDRLTASLGRVPTVGEVADAVGFGRERVTEAVRVREARFVDSGEHLAETHALFDDPALAAVVTTALGQLAPEQRELIEYRFRDGLTQSEIGDLLEISQPQVHRRLASTIARLRAELEEDES